jgi:two-component system chemotaxis response regulator CheY
MKTILIVDDSATLRRMVRAALRPLDGVRFTEAGNGLEAIERLSLAPVDLLVLDLNMPDMHGMEVLGFLRSQEAFRPLPVVILTTRDDEVSRSAALAAGANAYLCKPFAPADLAVTVARLLEPSGRDQP